MKLSKKHEERTPRPNEIGNMNTEGVSWRSHAGVMIPCPGLYQFQPISDRCLLRLSGQRLRLSSQQHISFRLVVLLKWGSGGGWGGYWLLYYIEVLKHSTHECFQASFIQPAVFFFLPLIENTTSSKGVCFTKSPQSKSLQSFLKLLVYSNSNGERGNKKKK